MNYKETNIAGTQYQRSSGGSFVNPIDGQGSKGISFREDQVINTGAKQIVQPVGDLFEPLNATNATTIFQILDPTTDLPIGQTRTYQDVYLMLYSLYRHCAKKRDLL